MSLLHRKLVVVHGKGGVGRTATTAALGLAAARQGLHTCIIELGEQESLARLVGLSEGSYTPREIAPRLSVSSMSMTACLSDFGKRKLRIDTLARWFFESRIMTGFVEAVPGLQDVIQLGKVENMIMEPLPGEPVWDLVILDAPASGHGLTLLGAAETMGEMTRVGPFYELAEIIRTFIGDPERTAHVVVTLPEALPVSECLQVIEQLAQQGTTPSAVVVNQVRQAPLPDVPAAAELRAWAHQPHDGADATLAGLLADADARLHRQADALEQLSSRLPTALPGAPTVHMPHLPRRPVGVEALAPLADALGSLP